MTGAVVSASADAGGHGRAVGHTMAAGPAAIHETYALSGGVAPAVKGNDFGHTRGAGGPSGGGPFAGGSPSGGADNGNSGSPSGGADNGINDSPSGGADNGNSGSHGHASQPVYPTAGSGGGSGTIAGPAGRDGSPASSSGSPVAPPAGGSRGDGGRGSSSGDTNSGGATPGSSSGSQDGGPKARGSGSGNSSSGSRGTSGGNGLGGTSGRCGAACQITPQSGSVGTVTFTQAPTPVTTPTPTPTPTPVATPRPNLTPSRHVRTSGTYSTSARPIGSTRHASATTGLAGLGVGAAVTPTVRVGTSATGSTAPVGTPSSISTLLGSTSTIHSSATRGRDQDAGVERTAPRPVVTQPVAQQTFIGSIEQAIPASIWLALAAALAFGAVGTGWALYSGHRVRRQAGAFAAMSTAALTDQLTGLLNRRGFLEAVERELARARRYGRGFVLAYVDVRGLKGVNDTEGHRAGDELLKEAASLLQDSARADDVVGRLGGDEMGLLLVEQGPGGADAVRRRVESQVPERQAKLGLHSPWDLTIGTAAFPEDGETVDDLLRAADLRLYEQRGIELIDR